MNFPDIDPNALIILVIMIIGALKWLIDHFKGERPLGDDDSADSQTPFQDLYEEARREIQDRQSRSAPPPEREERPARPAIFEPLQQAAPPPATPPPLPAQKHKPAASLSPYQTKPKRPSLSAAEKAALERLEPQRLQSQRRRGGRSHSRVRQLLASPSSARDAVVLREILGPPKGSLWNDAPSS